MKQMPYKDVADLLDETDLRLIDVRETDEYDEVHVEGVELFPLSRIRDGERPEPDERPCAIICRSGGRSERAARLLEKEGWAGGAELINVSDGTIGAVEAGEEHVVRGDEAPDA
jgi:rhodanese-related sulfurtransferase